MKLPAAVLCLLFYAAPAPAEEGPPFIFPAHGGEPAQLSIASPLLSMKPLPFRIELKEPENRLRPESLQCELDMPAMPMPENRVQALRADQAFEGEMVLTMAGDWRMRCASKDEPASRLWRFDIPGVRLR